MCIFVCMFVNLCDCIVNSLHWVNRVLSIRCVWEESSVIDVCSYVSCCVLVGMEYLES